MQASTFEVRLCQTRQVSSLSLFVVTVLIMSTFDDATHEAIKVVISQHPHLKDLYETKIALFCEKWNAKYNRQQIIFMARVTAYVLVLREALLKKGEINWKLLSNYMPVMGPRFLPSSLENVALTAKSVSHYYLKPFTVVDPELYSPHTFRRKDMCARVNHISSEGIRRKELTLPKMMYGLTCMEMVIGVTHQCDRCGKPSTTTSNEFWERIQYFKRPGLSNLSDLYCAVLNFV